MQSKIMKQRKGMGFFDSNMTLMVAVALVLVGISIIFGQSAMPQVQPAPIVIGDAQAILTSGAASATGYTDRLIAQKQERVKADPSDYKSFSQLGIAYLQKARETNDPTFYSQAEDAFKKSLVLKSDDFDALAGYGSLELSRHEFQQALEWGMKAQRANPAKAYAYGVVGDAHIELGNYDQAVDAFQKMVDLRPDLSSYSRVSYARELYGDTEGAIVAMRQAISAGGPAAENTAWCRVQLGHLYFNSNRLAEAEKEYGDALRGYPDYLHALAGMAQVRWAQGRTDEAIKLYQQSVEGVPLPQYLTALGDVYASTGNTAAAKEQYDLVQYIFQVFEAGGVDVNIEKATFLADHDMQLPDAVRMAETVAQGRKDVNTQSTLAWALYKSGRYQEALTAQKEAMRLGTQNPVFYYHLGMIYDRLGDKENARANVQKALDLNPHFSPLFSKEAEAYLTK
ncbi:MAG TPA: tetratricopeptide repeat protein [Chloroflexia bacterium]|nr:tetratricopeptide repeat protein [Chloroflexia bacterium]